MLPTFLGIGAPKAGTTWLYQLLDSHPDVCMSRDRKEVHFFDRHFDRGTGWYEGFFAVEADRRPRAVGEYTTHYLYDPLVPERVRTVPSIDRFVLVVRNPVERAFSHFRFRQRQDNHRLTFVEFLAREPKATTLGLYGRNLATWLDNFDRSWFLVLPFEEAVRAPQRTQQLLADHLGLDAGRFPASAPRSANESFVPRRRGLYAAAVRQARWLRRHDLDRLIALTKRSGAAELLKRRGAEPGGAHSEAESGAGPRPDDLSPALRRTLWEGYEDDVVTLEKLTGLDLAAWRPAEP